MDPTAPNNTNDQNPQASPNSIQPGQFVVAGGTEPKSTVPTPDSSPNDQTEPADKTAVFNDVQTQNPIRESEYQTPQVTPGQNLEPQPQVSPQPIVNPAPSQFQETQPPPGGLNLAHETSPLDTPAVPSAENSQPDPTPFVPPGSPTTQAPQELPQEESSNKLKLLLMAVGVLVLVAIIGGLLWFFVFNKKAPQSAKTENSQSVQIDEPSPTVKRTTGGFADLPPTTESTASAKSPITH